MTLKTISPIDQSIYAERSLANADEIESALVVAKQAQQEWRRLPLSERQSIIHRATAYFLQHKEKIAEELTCQMGRPIQCTPGEVDGFAERAYYMSSIAEAALADIELEPIEGVRRFIAKEPRGIVAIIAPWNYPYLTAANALIPALLAGNAVILKHSHQTPLCAERLVRAFSQAGLPDGVFQYLHCDHAQTEKLIQDSRINYVCFTGSVNAGKRIQSVLAGTFKGLTLELGGKDPAYVRADANLEQAVESLIDGAFFNSGQSCCGVERIYVHQAVYEKFVEHFAQLTEHYKLGDPRKAETTLGPMVTIKAADFIRNQMHEAIQAGAKALIHHASHDEFGSAYLFPQVLINVDHTMSVMRDESFGPIVGIMSVESDKQVIELMNDSPYGLTASIWTQDEARAIALGEECETGTVFMNRCDYLDPALAWTGVKETGYGISLSRLGFDAFTQVKSFHIRR